MSKEVLIHLLNKMEQVVEIKYSLSEEKRPDEMHVKVIIHGWRIIREDGDGL